MALSTRATVILIVATIVGGLWLDQHVAGWGQVATNVVAWIVFLCVLRPLPAPDRQTLLLCVLIATAGECFLSLAWGLYSYRLDNIPLFVPPGHALLFVLGLTLAPHLTNRVVWAVPLVAAPFVLLLALTGADTLGVPLYALFVLCLVVGRAKKLYAAMFVLALAMELYGTWLGNWVWVERAPWLGLATLNPPLAAGAFYCVLDLLVTALGRPATGRLMALRPR
jgi:hypothetical protein